MKVGKLIASSMLTLLLLVTFMSLIVDRALSNPIRWPPIWLPWPPPPSPPVLQMPYAYIYASISLKEGELIADVIGIYKFISWGYESVTMRYPVPPDATVVYVKVDNNLLSWWSTNDVYPTFVGNFTMIEWIIKPVPESFNVTVNYRHPLHLLSPQTSGVYAFLYAMGTGRLLANWYGRTTANVTIKVGKNVVQPNGICLETVGLVNSTWVTKPASFNLTSEDETWVLHSTFQSEYDQPLKEDLLLTLAVHDVAVVDVTPEYNFTYKGWWPVNINVTVINEGNFSETVTLDLYYNITESLKIGTQTFTLDVGETKTLTFAWNTADVTPCRNYTLTAKATIDFDIDLTDNILESPAKVKVSMLGDTNGDGVIDMRDVARLAIAFGSYPGHPKWDRFADINMDLRVDLRDIAIVARRFGKTCT